MFSSRKGLQFLTSAFLTGQHWGHCGKCQKMPKTNRSPGDRGRLRTFEPLQSASESSSDGGCGSAAERQCGSRQSAVRGLRSGGTEAANGKIF